MPRILLKAGSDLKQIWRSIGRAEAVGFPELMWEGCSEKRWLRDIGQVTLNI